MTHPMNQAPQQPAPGLVRSIALASIGLISMLGDRLEEAYERSLQRQGAASGSHQKAGVSQFVFDEWESALSRLNLPTKSDLDALSQQMTALEEQIDRLATQRTANQSKE
jgi:hypothetical protein